MKLLFSFKEVLKRLSSLGYLAGDVKWSENIKPPQSADEFALEAAFVICNSGMKNTVARGIYNRVRDALQAGRDVFPVFKHPGKAAAIETIWRQRHELFEAYALAEDRVAFLETLPWIGSITKYHLAKNFGIDCVKPDLHLQRLADAHGTTPHLLCAGLARRHGYRVATIDLLLWRACANGVINSRTGRTA